MLVHVIHISTPLINSRPGYFSKTSYLGRPLKRNLPRVRPVRVSTLTPTCGLCSCTTPCMFAQDTIHGRGAPMLCLSS